MTAVSDDHEELIAMFQARLLALLDSNLKPEDIIEALLKDESFNEFRGFLQAFDPDMVEVAASLVKKWGVRRKS